MDNIDTEVFLGVVIGSLLITGLTSRAIGFILVKTNITTYKAACWLTFVLCSLIVLALTNIANVGIPGLSLYIICQALWLLFDLVRRPKENVPDEAKRNLPDYKKTSQENKVILGLGVSLLFLTVFILFIGVALDTKKATISPTTNTTPVYSAQPPTSETKSEPPTKVDNKTPNPTEDNSEAKQELLPK